MPKLKKTQKITDNLTRLINTFILILFVLLFSACKEKITEEVIEKYADGSPKIVRFYKEIDNTKTLFKECLYYPNHNKYMEGTYKEGKRDGKWKSWYDNGNLWSEGHFKNGLDDGKRIVYHENGNKYFEGEYSEGNKIGKWKFYDQNGNFVKEESYNH